jgi:hypothetical protein
MAIGLALRNWDRRDSAQAGEGGLAVETLGIVAGRDEQRSGDVGADALDGEKLRRGGADELLQVPVQGIDLGTELPIADGEPFKASLAAARGMLSAVPDRTGRKAATQVR